MPMTRTAVISLVLTAAAHSTLTAQDSTHRQSGVMAGAGVNVVSNARSGAGFPLALQLGYEWAKRGSPLSLRLSADRAATRASTRLLFNPFDGSYQANSSVATRTSDISLGLAGVYTLHTGRLEPYLLSGVAIQRRSQANEVLMSGTGDTFRENLYSSGLTAGLGLRAHLLGSTVFVEARTYVPAFGDVRGRRTGTNPLTFGLRF